MQVPSLLQAAPFKDRTFTFALTPKLYERIAELAQVSKLSQAEVARRLIEIGRAHV